MRIGEVAEASGVSVRSLRYYEGLGLISSARTPGGWRDFAPEMVERVITIQHLLAAGLTGDSIGRILPCLRASAEERTGEMERLIAENITRLEERRRDLDREIDVLRGLQAEVAAHSGPAGDKTSGATATDRRRSERPHHLRLIVETEDVTDALRFYRDTLGLPEQAAFGAAGEERVAILPIDTASIEIANPAHARAVDRAEGVAEDIPPAPRIALEVDDVERTVAAAERDGRRTLAAPQTTPFRTISARVAGPAGWQVTFFRELEDLGERTHRPGFSLDGERSGQG